MKKKQKIIDLYIELQNLDISDWNVRGKPIKKVSEYDLDNVFENLISPNSKTANNLDSEVVVVLQDWASQEQVQCFLDAGGDVLRYGYDPKIRTNRVLRDLLIAHFSTEIGLSKNAQKDPTLAEVFEKIYITNVFQFLKPGSMSSNIPNKYIKDTAVFTKKEIEIIQPKLVICLGSQVFQSMAETSDDHELIGNTLYFKQYHPAARVSTTLMHESWGKMKALTISQR